MQMAPAKGNIPDSFVLVRINAGTHVLGSWNGGYLYGSSWRFSTQIVKSERIDDKWVLGTRSGSSYILPAHEAGRRYGMNSVAHGAYESFADQAKDSGLPFELIPESEIDNVLNQLEN